MFNCFRPSFMWLIGRKGMNIYFEFDIQLNNFFMFRISVLNYGFWLTIRLYDPEKTTKNKDGKNE